MSADYFGPITPNNLEKALREQLARSVSNVLPPRALDRGSFNQMRSNVAKLNNMKAAVAMNPGKVAVPRPMTAPPGGRDFSPPTRPPAPGASIRRLALPMVPGSGAPKLLPQFTPKAMPPARAVPLALKPLNAGVVNPLGQAQRMFPEAPRAEMGLPNNFVAMSPAGQSFRRSPGFYAALAGLGEAQIIDLSGSFGGLGQGDYVPTAVIKEAIEGLGLGEGEYVPTAVIKESVDGLGITRPGASSNKTKVTEIILPTPKQLKTEKKKRGGGLRGVYGLGALADVKNQVKQNFNIIVDIAVVPVAEKLIITIIDSAVYQEKIGAAGNTVLGGLGFNPATRKLDPNGLAMSAIRKALVDAAFNNLNSATKVFDKINDFLETVGFPLLNLPRNFKKEVIKQIWVEAYGGEAALEPDPALLDRMDLELKSVQSVDTLSQKILENPAYAPSPAQPPAAPGTPTGESAAPVAQETIAKTEMSNTRVYMIAGGVVLLGVIALTAVSVRR